ncbi:unnamed protein product, partial [marine sediment metagenome]
LFKYIRNTDSVVDLGCAEGNLMKDILTITSRVVGVDLDRNYLEIAKKDNKISN